MTTNQSRVPAGVTTGGQFSASTRDEATGVQLHSSTDREVLRRRMNAAVDRANMHRSAGLTSDGEEAAALRVVGVAAAVRMNYPNATSIELVQSDQPGSNTMWIHKIRDADGNDLTDAYLDLGDESDCVDDLLIDALDSVPYVGGLVNGLTANGNPKWGLDATIDIDQVLTGPLEPKPVVPGEKGEQAIKTFRAQHGDTDADAVGSARDLLTELHHWARANGHDLQALVTAAGEVADEEQALAAHESAA